MARLASIEKAGFYSTAPRVVDMIASMVHPGIGAVILDPCCGEGDALAALGKAWGAITIGNELSKERAAKAAAQCDVVTHGPVEFLQVEEDCRVSALFLNPPYDVGESGQRLELEFLKMATPWLTPLGWLFYIVPDYVIKEDIVDYLARWYEFLYIYRFPEPEYQAFKQTVIVGKKRLNYSRFRYQDKREFGDLLEKADCHVLCMKASYIHLPAVAKVPETAVNLPDAAETLALAAEHGPITMSVWENLTNPRGLLGKFQPVNKPLPGHAAMLVMDGKVDGTEVLTEEGECLLLRGSTVKIVKTEETSERAGDKVRHKKVEKEQVVTVIHALNLNTGALEKHNSQAAAEFEEFLTLHQDKLIGAVDALYPPLFVPSRDMPTWFDKLRRIHGPQPLPGSDLNGLLPKQAECAVALAMLLERQKAGLLIGECGIGKTCLSLALQGLSSSGNFKIVVMAPAQVCAKWARESKAVLQEFGLKSHIIGKKRGGGKRGKPILDIVKAMEEPNPSLLVMSYETAKNGPPWEPAFNVKTRQVTWTETKTEHLNYYPYTQETEVEYSETRNVACCPDCGATLREDDGAPWPVSKTADWWKKQQRFCPECSKPHAKTPLFQSLPFKYGGRAACATFLNRKYAGRFGFILDECFPGNTLVATPDGPKLIKDIGIGDSVLTEKDGRVVTRRVVRIIKKRRAGKLVKVVHGGGSFICTPNHRVYVDGESICADKLQRGYHLTSLCNCGTIYLGGIDDNHNPNNLPNLRRRIPSTQICQGANATHLQPIVWGKAQVSKGTAPRQRQAEAPTNEDMRVLRQGISSLPSQRIPAILFQVMQLQGSDDSKKACPMFISDEGDHGQARNETISFRTDEKAQSGFRNPRKECGQIAGAHFLRQAWWQWPDHRTTESTSNSIGTGMGNGIHDPDRQSQMARSYSGHRQSLPKDSSRGGWRIPPHQETAKQRPHQKGDAGSPGVEDVAFLEFRDRERFSLYSTTVLSIEPIETEDEFVYNLEIEDTHRYFADGILVSNCHNTKARLTDISQAAMKLISAATKVVGMTGTIYDGKASGVFAILYRLLPEFRQLYDFTQVKKFVEHHGLQEKITTKTEKAGSRSTSTWGYGRENVRTREIPGITPGIISWILRMSVFIRKKHIADNLPDYTEYRVPVETSEEQQQTLKDLNNAHLTAAAKCRRGKMGLMSQWLYAACGALDYGQDDVIADDEDSFSIASCTKPGMLLPKDQAVLDIVKREIAADRGVGVYFSQVNRRDWMPRFQKVLEENDILSVILRANTCRKADREKWFQGTVRWFASKGQPVVMLANGNLVKEGLDLVECPTLVETGIDFRLINVLQRDQRAHRIIQDKDCKVYFVYYAETFQETALSLVAAKARAARKMEGKLIDGLAQMGAEEDLMSALIKAAQAEARPTVIDWGDLKVDDLSRPIAPETLTVDEAAAILTEAAGPRKTLTIDFLDAVERMEETGVSTRTIAPIQIEDFEQLSLF